MHAEIQNHAKHYLSAINEKQSQTIGEEVEQICFYFHLKFQKLPVTIRGGKGVRKSESKEYCDEMSSENVKII